MLFTSMVRPHLEYGASVWNPNRLKNIKAIEAVQRRATKLVREVSGKAYEERIRILGLTTLEERRSRGDQIQQFKIKNGLNKISFCSSLTQEKHNHGTRQQNFLTREQNKSDIRYNFFTNRIVKQWNQLPVYCQNLKTTTIFKNNYDKFIKNDYLQLP
jgi:hypothetical protein